MPEMEEEEDEAGQGQEEKEDTREEAMRCQVVRDPGEPSQRERDEHDVTHLPFRSWCRICLEAKGKEKDHRKASEERNCRNCVSATYVVARRS